jgi:hypothetical protein
VLYLAVPRPQAPAPRESMRLVAPGWRALPSGRTYQYGLCRIHGESGHLNTQALGEHPAIRQVLCVREDATLEIRELLASLDAMDAENDLIA